MPRRGGQATHSKKVRMSRTFRKYWKRTGKFGVAEIEKEIEDVQRFQKSMF